MVYEPLRTTHLGKPSAPDTLAVVDCAASGEVEDRAIVRLAVDDQRAFAEAILEPPSLSPAMERARTAHDRLILK